MTTYYHNLYFIGLLCIILLGFSLGSNAQDAYEFEYSTGSYTNLSGSTSLNNGQLWDDPEYHIPIGFTFEFFDQSYDSIYISDYAWFDPNNKYEIYAYDSDFIDKGTSSSLSPISYLLSGSSGSRILKIEWNNAGFYDDNTLADNINVQLWIYEGSNRIEVRIGPNSVLNPDSYGGLEGGVIGVVDYLTVDEFYLVGTPDSTVINQSFGEVNGTPASGSIYAFTRCINPGASYSYSVDSNFTASFTSSNLSATFSYWDFGDSTTSSLENPTHTYADTGKYLGTHIISNNCDTDTLVSLICIYPDAPIVSDVSDAPLVSFNTPTTNGISYYWDFGDSSGAAGKAQTHTYTLPGTYVVALVIDYGCGPDSLFDTISPSFVGIDELAIESEELIEMYPNPASKVLTLKPIMPNTHITVKIMDITGREVINGFSIWASESKNVDISKLKPGMYTLLATDGERVVGKKLVKN